MEAQNFQSKTFSEKKLPSQNNKNFQRQKIRRQKTTTLKIQEKNFTKKLSIKIYNA